MPSSSPRNQNRLLHGLRADRAADSLLLYPFSRRQRRSYSRPGFRRPTLEFSNRTHSTSISARTDKILRNRLALLPLVKKAIFGTASRSNGTTTTPNPV